MKEFNEIAVKKIINDMIRAELISANEQFTHDDLVDIYNNIADSDNVQVIQRYNQYFNEVIIVNN